MKTKVFWFLSLLVVLGIVLAAKGHAEDYTTVFGKIYRIKVLQTDPIHMDETGKWSCQFVLSQSDLISDQAYIDSESTCTTGSFQFDILVNGQSVCKSGGGHGRWSGSVLGIDMNRFVVGTNTIELLDTSDRNTTGGVVRNIQLLLKAMGKVDWQENLPIDEYYVWYPGDPHTHTTFSDGSNNIPQQVDDGKKRGLKFIGISDHYEQIDSKEKEPAKLGRPWNLSGVDIGWSDYLRNCREQSNDKEFVVLPCTEITTFWRAEPETKDASHVLELGLTEDKSDPVIDTLQSQFDTQSRVIKHIQSLGHLSIAAHSALISRVNFGLRPWEQQRNRFDHRTEEAYKGINGVEFFNCANNEQEEEVLDWYLSMIAKHWPVFAATGSDLHNWVKLISNQKERSKRKFWVKAKELTLSSLLEGMMSGRTYASAHNVRLNCMNHTPGFAKQKVKEAFLQFGIRVDNNDKPQKLACFLYRDGRQVDSQSFPISWDQSNCDYEFKDREVTFGEHWYVFVVKNYIVTSPVVLEVGN